MNVSEQNKTRPGFSLRNALQLLYVVSLIIAIVYGVEWVLAEPQEYQRDMYISFAEYSAKYGRIEQALSECRKASEYAPDDEHPYYIMGTIYQDKQKDIDSAILCYRKSIELNPNAPWAYYRMGQCLLWTKKDTADAIAAWNSSAEFASKDYLLPLVALAGYYRDKRDFETSTRLFKKTLSLNPRDFESAYGCALDYREMGMTDSFQIMLQRAAGINSRRFEPYFHLGNLAFQKNDFKLALNYFERSRQQNDSYNYSHHMIGVCLKAMGREAEAIQSFQKSIELQPDYKQSWIELISVFRKIQKDKEVMAVFMQASKQFPSDPDFKLKK